MLLHKSSENSLVKNEFTRFSVLNNFVHFMWVIMIVNLTAVGELHIS